MLVRPSSDFLELTTHLSRAFATTSSLSDRLKLQRNAAYPDWVLAPQVLLNCALGAECSPRSTLTVAESGLYGCNGGSAHKAMEYIYKYVT